MKDSGADSTPTAIPAPPVLDPGAARLAVLGDPIAHSMSPQLHLAAAEALGLRWQYDRWRIPAGHLAASLSARGAGWRGVSVTAPLKAEALAFADSASALASRTNAANTLVFDGPDSDARAYADNTDVAGVRAALAARGIVRIEEPVDVLGAGGTAASVVAALFGLGARLVRVRARRATASAALVARATAWTTGEDGHPPLGAGARIEAGDLHEWRPDRSTRFVADTVPGGFATRAGAPDPEAVLFSAAYSPWPTPLATMWEASGGTVVSGAEMLLHQAIVQDRLFTGRRADEPLPNERGILERMRAARTHS